MTALTTTNFTLDVETNSRIERLANARHRSADAMIREAVSQYVAREDARERFQADGVAAWQRYQETGLHATGEEVDVWLAQLEAGENMPPRHATIDMDAGRAS